MTEDKQESVQGIPPRPPALGTEGGMFRQTPPVTEPTKPAPPPPDPKFLIKMDGDKGEDKSKTP